jgi:hypothetical protein
VGGRGGNRDSRRGMNIEGLDITGPCAGFSIL